MLDIEEVIPFAQSFLGRELSEDELMFILSERKADSLILPRQSDGREFITLVRLVDLRSIISKAKEQNISLKESMSNFVKANQVPVPIVDVTRIKGGYGKQERELLSRYSNSFEAMIKSMEK